MTAINVPLLRKTLEHIEAHPQEWRQEVWRCGTAACFAGHAAMLAGVKDVKDDAHLLLAEREQQVIYKGERLHISDAAQEALGLDDDQRFDLFHGGNTIDDLRRIVAELCARAES